MAFTIDMNGIDIYDAVFAILGVEPTGDPVNDAVYKLLLPLIVLYLYSSFVITRSRFGGTKASIILTLIVGYIVIDKGYYKLFVNYSLPLLGIIMIYHAGAFIFGRGMGRDEKKGKESMGFQTDVDEGSGGIADVVRYANPKNIRSEVDRKIGQVRHDLKDINTTDAKKAIAELGKLEDDFVKCETARHDAEEKGWDTRGINQTRAELLDRAKREIAFGKLTNSDVLDHAKATEIARALGIR